MGPMLAAISLAGKILEDAGLLLFMAFSCAIPFLLSAWLTVIVHRWWREFDNRKRPPNAP
jgi:hypothetical protein